MIVSYKFYQILQIESQFMQQYCLIEVYRKSHVSTGF